MKWLVGLFAVLLSAPPAAANQWVSGRIDGLWDYTAFDATIGIFVTLGNVSWGSGSPSTGPANCNPARLRLAVGNQGITTDSQNRMYATLLTARATGQNVVFYVDTQTTAPYCAVQITMVGQPLP